MKSVPTIVVQIVHIQGPLKGEIQEFSDPEISIGRKPTCHVNFPGDLTVISRLHAEIIREGNRFKLIDRSSNGTFVNGKEISEHFLKNGDVMMFAEDGPKASFLSEVKNLPREEPEPAAPSALPDMPRRPVNIPPSTTGPDDMPPPPDPGPLPEKNQAVEPPAGKTKAPLVIQYGPKLHSFDELPITIGSSPACSYRLEHPGILAQHAQVFFHQGQYWLKDLTGKQLIIINDIPVGDQAVLTPESRLFLTADGPKFQFIGGGRLLEIEDPLPEIPPDTPPETGDPASPAKEKDKGPVSALKKLWQR